VIPSVSQEFDALAPFLCENRSQKVEWLDLPLKESLLDAFRFVE
jgi:hypothetical protein